MQKGRKEIDCLLASENAEKKRQHRIAKVRRERATKSCKHGCILWDVTKNLYLILDRETIDSRLRKSSEDVVRKIPDIVIRYCWRRRTSSRYVSRDSWFCSSNIKYEGYPGFAKICLYPSSSRRLS
jgi:hypothetical protein